MTTAAPTTANKSQNLVDKKIFLMASEDPVKMARFQELIEKITGAATFYTAQDGATALSKISNAPPHILITDVQLPKLSGLNLIEKVSAIPHSGQIAIILVGMPPEQEKYLDEIVTGKIQYLIHPEDEAEFSHCLMKALNFASHSTKANFYIRFVAQNEVLLREGDKADYVYFVKKGRLKVFKKLSGAATDAAPQNGAATVPTEEVLGYVEPGEFVGEMAYINGEPRSANVSALTECELIEVPIGTFDIILYKRPSWSKALMLTLSKRVKNANNKK